MNTNARDAFTTAVKTYLDNGYLFNVETMSGLQGEVARVDLVKDTCFLRVMMYKDYIKQCYVLSVGSIHRDDGKFVGTIWNDDLTIINSIEVK